jgi:hypothetical protein
MNKIAASLAALGLSAFAAVPAAAESPRMIGRVLEQWNGDFTVQWAGSGFEAVFTGSWLAATIQDWGDSAYDIEVDGKTSVLDLQAGKHTYTLYSGQPGEHRIRVTRRTGPISGPTYFSPLQAEKHLRGTNPPERKMLVLGSSMTTGYGIDGDGPTCEATYATHNNAKTFTALAARELHAEVHVIATEGRGVVFEYGGTRTPTEISFNRQALPWTAHVWDTRKYKPDVIVIALGTTDFDKTDPGAEFDNAYLAMLRELRVSYPGAQIIATSGPKPDGALGKAFAESVQEAVATQTSNGDKKVSYLNLVSHPSEHQWGCGWQPGVGAHRDMANQLEQAIQETIGWQSEQFGP